MKYSRVFLILVLMLLLFACSLFDGSNTIALDQITYFETTKIKDLENYQQSAFLSPDGEKIAFIDPEEICIFEISEKTEDCKNFPDGFRPDLTYVPKWSPDSRYVVMTEPSLKFMVDSDIWIFDSQTEDYTNLTNDGYEAGILKAEEEIFVDVFPTWTGKNEITFARWIMGGNEQNVTFNSVDIDGKVSQVYDPDLQVIPGVLAISPDGSQFIYAEYSVRSDFYLFDSKTGDEDKILSDTSISYFPDFTPDMDWAILQLNGGLDIRDIPALILVPLDSGEETVEIEFERTETLTFISISPDSKGFLAMVYDMVDDESVLYAIDLTGSRTKIDSYDGQLRAAAFDFTSEWSQQNTLLSIDQQEEEIILLELGEE